MARFSFALLLAFLLLPAGLSAQKYADSAGRLRVALAKQPFSPSGTSRGPETMAAGGIQDALTAIAIGFATIPSDDPDGSSIAALNRMIEGAVRGVARRERAAAETH